MKLRISKSEVDLVVAKLLIKGEKLVSDTKVGTKRIIETDKTRVTFTANGWVDIQLK